MDKKLYLAIATLVLNACASQDENPWKSIDYSPVYKKAQGREYDPGYELPAGGCVDDDLC